MSSIYPSLESLLVTNVISQNKTVEEVKNTYLQDIKTKSKNIKFKDQNNPYNQLNNMLNDMKHNTLDIDIKETNNTQINLFDNKIYQNMKKNDGVREVIIKRISKKLGIGLTSIDKSFYISFIESGSIASKHNIKLGDQVIRINSMETSGVSPKTLTKYIKSIVEPTIFLIVRDRPLQRVFELYKNRLGYIGIQYKYGVIIRLIQNSSAAKNGVPVNHKIVEINNQNVIGLSDKDLTKIIHESGHQVYIGIMKNMDYKELMKGNSKKTLKNMDHTKLLF
jgi:C-terminal processing protease CtpA/Prc